MTSLVLVFGMLVVPLILAAWRIGRMVSWRSLLMVAMATGSLKACVAFIRYCERL